MMMDSVCGKGQLETKFYLDISCTFFLHIELKIIHEPYFYRNLAHLFFENNAWFICNVL